jgi:hypothetical protein
MGVVAFLAGTWVGMTGTTVVVSSAGLVTLVRVVAFSVVSAAAVVSTADLVAEVTEGAS